jgi:DNA-binding FadR family transcriptional regulator
MRDLAEAMGVSVPTVRVAIHGLEALGLVEVRTGRGTFVRSPREEQALFSVAVRRAAVEELADLRAQLEIHAGACVAARLRRRASPNTADIVNMFAGERWHHRIPADEAFVDADLAFHAAFAGAARKELGMTIAVQRWVSGRLRRSLLLAAEPMAADPDLDDQHFTLAEAMLSRRADDVEALARSIALRERDLTLEALR